MQCGYYYTLAIMLWPLLLWLLLHRGYYSCGYYAVALIAVAIIRVAIMLGFVMLLYCNLKPYFHTTTMDCTTPRNPRLGRMK